MFIKNIFNSFNSMLPNKEVCKSVSIYPLPYDNFFEIYIETDKGKKYRALADNSQILSAFSEFKIPGATK